MTQQHQSAIADIASRLSIQLTQLEAQLMVIVHVQEHILEDFSVFDLPLLTTDNEHLFYDQSAFASEILKCYRTSMESRLKVMNEQVKRIHEILKPDLQSKNCCHRNHIC